MTRVSNNPRRGGPAAGAEVSSPSPQQDPLIVVGASVRGLAASAFKAGHEVHAADLFGDQDLRAVAASWTCPRPYPGGLPEAVATLPAGPWVYTGALENHPQVIAAIARHRTLAGCPAEVIAAVRDPVVLAATLPMADLAYPETRGDPAGLPRDGSWLLKPRRSAGGHGIVPWTSDVHAAGSGVFPADPVVWQRHIRGRAAAAAYLVAGGSGRLVGVSLQLVGRDWCHAGRFCYCGSVDLDPATLPPHAVERLLRLGGLLAERFGLVGFVGVDLVIDRTGHLYVIEVNPRPTASLELIERATGLSIAAGQLAACGLGPPPLERPRVGSWSKAILFAPHDISVTERTVATLCAAAGRASGGWPMVADIPCPSQVIPAGRPICTLFGHGPTPPAALGQLRRRTGAVATALRDLSPPSAAAQGAPRHETASGTRLRWSLGKSL